MSVLTTIFGFVSEVIKPVTTLIDEITTSDEERLGLKNKLFELQAGIQIKMMEYEAKLIDSRAKIVTAEATGQSWLQRNWRPITMITFLFLIVLNTLGLTAVPIAGQMWTLLQIGLGGYVVGRSAEKIIPKIMEKKNG
jgi:hypothetical protein